MRAADLDIRELLDVDPQGGVVRFAGRRAIIFDAVAMGLLRKQLVHTFGSNAARAAFTRFGFAHGWGMAEAMRSEVAWDSDAEWRNAGGVIHMLQGHIRLEPGAGDPFSPKGATLQASYEAEQHQLHLGRSEEPVCWTLSGIASGYLSRTEGKSIYVIEHRCLGMGHAACRFRARPLEAWGAEIDAHLPFFEQERLDAPLHNVAVELKRTERKLRERRRALARATGEEAEPTGMVTRSPGMRLVLDLATRLAKVESTVLITGESGVGKERVARLVHDESARAAGPFLAINCGAIAEALLESELFGHARGAFTGATQDRVGLFEAASGGTLLLDEVGELAAGMQVKLLRALQEREVRRLGENRSRPIDVRVVAATNRDLTGEVAAGRFRKDLYYRLKVVELRVPPLRERREDILPLSRVLLADAAQRMKRQLSSLTPRAADQLVRHEWPGNVRELENAMERAVALAQGRRVDLEDLPEDVRRALPIPTAITGVRTLLAVEKDYILAVLEENGGNQTRAAAQLGIGPSTLYRKLKEYRGAAPRRGR